MAISLRALSICITWCRFQPLKRITSWIQLMIYFLYALIAMRCCTGANHRLRRRISRQNCKIASTNLSEIIPRRAAALK
ncbi:hypothetical protein [Escherichia coli]|uniref:hypothetical protein n=1 Tax=Escherichia coli TaxID=562 RepID=UPI003D9A8E32